MLSTYDYLVVLFYLIFLASMGWAFKRLTRGSTDYFAGGFRMTWWLLGASSFVSNFSCWTFTGAANIAYTYGLLVFGISVVDALGFALSALWFAPRFRQMRLVTAIDAVRLRFGRFNEQFFNFLGFLSSLATAAVWMVGLSIVLSSAFHFPQVPVILVTGAVVIIIALLGGNWAVAASDFVQLLLLISVSVVAGVLTVIKVGGVHAFLTQIPETHWQIFKPLGSISYDWLYLATSLITATYMRNNVLASAKYIAAKDARHARWSALIPMCGFLVLPIFWFIPPLAAGTLVPNLAQVTTMKIPGEASYIAVCLQVLPQGLIGLMIAGLFSATIASIDVALNKNAGFFVKNFYQPMLRPHALDRELLIVGELATLGFGVLITVGAIVLVAAPNLSLFDAYLYLGAYIGMPLAVPLFMGMLVRRTPLWAGWATVLAGVALTVLFYDVLPTALGRGLFEPWLGTGAYRYAVTNKFVVTNLVGAPLTILFFLGTRWFHRAVPSSYEQQVDEFFLRMKTPVDFEREVGNDNSERQAAMLGKAALIYGGAILLLVLIPNPWSGRLGILACASTVIGVGIGLLYYAHRLRQQQENETGGARAATAGSQPFVP